MQEWKASEKEAQKMTRDGAISVNLVTGEATHVSDRPPEQDYSSADETAGVLSRAVDEAAGHVERRQAKKARRKRRDTFRDGEAARDRPSSRLQFSEADRAAPELKKAVRKSNKAADKLDAAKAAVPVKPPGKEHGNPLFAVVGAVGMCVNGHACGTVGNDVCGLWESRRLFHRAVNICFPSAERPFSTFSSCKMVENVLCVALLRDKMYNKCG
ncbi:MAG: hypothetical protein ACLRNC_14410 [Gemmiger formicilis]|uniref:hypothetical protein n=1 Tax=Gemmiger formicilis TaxID=745368 RepID=UPI0039954C17